MILARQIVLGQKLRLATPLECELHSDACAIVYPWDPETIALIDDSVKEVGPTPEDRAIRIISHESLHVAAYALGVSGVVQVRVIDRVADINRRVLSRPRGALAPDGISYITDLDGPSVIPKGQKEKERQWD